MVAKEYLDVFWIGNVRVLRGVFQSDRRQIAIPDTRQIGKAFVQPLHYSPGVISIAGRKHWLWPAVDQDGCVLEEIVQSRRDTKAAKRVLISLLKKAGMPHKQIITDKLRSQGTCQA